MTCQGLKDGSDWNWESESIAYVSVAKQKVERNTECEGQVDEPKGLVRLQIARPTGSIADDHQGQGGELEQAEQQFDQQDDIPQSAIVDAVQTGNEVVPSIDGEKIDAVGFQFKQKRGVQGDQDDQIDSETDDQNELWRRNKFR